MLTEAVSSSLVFSSLFSLGVWSICTAVIIGWYKAPLYHPVSMYLIYHFLGYVYRPLIVYTNQYSVIWSRTRIFPGSEDIILTASLANIALLAMLAAFVTVNRRERIEPIQPFSLAISRPARFWPCLILLAALGLWGTYRSYGGAGMNTVQAFTVAVDQSGGQRLQGVSGYATALAEFLPPICILLFLVPKLRALALAAIVAFVALRLYVGAQRLSFILVIAAVALIAMMNQGRRWPKATTWAGLAITAFIFDVIGGDRFAFRRLFYGLSSPTELVSNYFERRGSGGFANDVVEFDVASAVAKLVPSETGWSYGSQYLRLIVWPIPRQLWPDKPVYTSTVNLNEHGYFFGLTHTLYMDAFMVFGVLSLAAIMFAVGYYLSKLYKTATHTQSVITMMFFWIQLLYTKTLFRDGGVTFVYFLAFSTLAVALLTWSGGVKLCRRAP